MKTCLVCSVIVLCATPLNVSAETFSWGDVKFQPRAYAGYANYSLEAGDYILTNQNGEIQTGPWVFDFFNHDKLQFSGVLWGIGTTVAAGQFFGDLYYQSTLNDVASSETEQQSPDFNTRFGDVNAQHSDWAISLGYMITDQWSVFAGYKSGNTEWDQVRQRNFLPPESGLAQSSKINGQFDQNGPFVGTSYSFLIGPGALTFKAAYAYLDGNYEDSLLVGYPSPPQSIGYKLDGNSNAYSIGISWTQPLANNMGLSLGANYQRYKFEMSGGGSETINGVATGLTVNGVPMTEELLTITASLTYTF